MQRAGPFRFNKILELPVKFFLVMFITVLLLFFISSPSTSNETSQIINQIKQTTNTFTHNDKINNVKQVHKILALVGIFSTWDRFHRRSLIRTTYMTARPDNLKIVFVFGKPINDTVRGLLELEQNAYNDVMILDINENMDNGKTYHYFKHVAALYNNDAPTFVMKTDDDVFLHLPNLAKRFSELPTVGTYWGREFAGFMAGMGYAVSWDIAYWVGTDEAPAKKTIGQEDSVFRSWIYENKKVVKAISEDKEFYDEPSSKEGWAHEYTNGTILIHRLKRDEWFIKAAAHFLLNKELNI